ncbi:hypothetical protein Z169_06421, partial [Egretta garzetta]
GSPQIVELAEVVHVFQKWSNTPINIVTDSAFVAGLVPRLENACLKEVINPVLFNYLSQLLQLLNNRKYPYFIMHIRAHTTLPGPLLEGNWRADALTLPVHLLPNAMEQAQISPVFFHQNARAFQKAFSLTMAQVQDIVDACPDCQGILSAVPNSGTNPQGLAALELWQTDVTRIPDFGCLKYVHVSVDTFSGAIHASCHTGEKARDVIKHFTFAFAAMGVAQKIKTDYGPAYVSVCLWFFSQDWGVRRITTIPHSPTGQAIVERSHHTLKHMLKQQKGG